MINWKKGTKETPKVGKRVIIQLSDGRVCSGIVTDSHGFSLEHVDSIDLLSYIRSEQKWIYAEE